MGENKYWGRDHALKRFKKHELDRITDSIDEKLHSFLKEGKYKEVLMAMGNLGRYSLNNQIFILLQKPDAFTVFGIRKWNELGRTVKKGEKAIRIMVPIVERKNFKVLDVDGKPIVDEYGEPKVIRKRVVTGFEQGTVFDFSQTEGPELNVFKFNESKTVENKFTIMSALKFLMKTKGYTISYTNEEELGKNCYGYCNKATKEIKLLEGMSDLQEISTAVHEVGHALAHSYIREDFKGLTSSEKRQIKEVEAESIACIVCTYLGLDTQNFNFSYIVGWSDGDISKFKENLGLISNYAREVIRAIEKEFKIQKMNAEISITNSEMFDEIVAY